MNEEMTHQNPADHDNEVVRLTKLKASEKERKQAVDTLRQSEERYRKLFTFSPIGTALFDLEGKYLEVNDAYAKILGVPKKTLLSGLAVEFSEEKELEKTLEDIDELFTRGITGGVRELQLHDRNLILSYVKTLLYDDKEKPVGIISMIKDITDLKGPERAIKEAHEFTEGIVKKVREPLVVPDTGLRVIPEKRRFFNLFKAIPQKIEREMIYEIEESRFEIPKFQKLVGKILHKSFALDDFEDEHESQSFWQRISRRQKL